MHEKEDMKLYPAMIGAALFALAVGNGQAKDVDDAPGFTYNFSVGAGGKGRNSGDAVLRVVQRKHTGRLIGMQVAGALLGGGVGGFSKNQLHGQRIKEIPNPGADVLQAALRAQVEDWQARNPQYVLDRPLVVDMQGGDWVLMYQELDEADSPYELRYSIRVGLRSPLRGFLRSGDSYGSFNCSPTPVVQPLPAWEDADYAGVREVRESYVAQCVEQFSKFFPQWMLALNGAGGNAEEEVQATVEVAADQHSEVGAEQVLEAPVGVEAGQDSQAAADAAAE